MSYLTDVDTDGPSLRYPEDKPWVQRDQGLRAADDTSYVVLCDVVSVLEAEINDREASGEDITTLQASLVKAMALIVEADAMPWDENHSWIEFDDGERSFDIYELVQDAENLDHVSVIWDGDAGSVLITIADHWEEYEDE